MLELLANVGELNNYMVIILFAHLFLAFRLIQNEQTNMVYLPPIEGAQDQGAEAADHIMLLTEHRVDPTGKRHSWFA